VSRPAVPRSPGASTRSAYDSPALIGMRRSLPNDQSGLGMRISQGATAPACIPAGFQFLNCVSRTALGEVWTVRDPNGEKRLLRSYFGCANEESPAEMDPVCKLEPMVHGVLPTLEVLQYEPGRLLLLTDCTPLTLRDRFSRYRAHGQSGIPREELLGYLDGAAAALDSLYEEHAVQHLGLNPQNIVASDEQTQ